MKYLFLSELESCKFFYKNIKKYKFDKIITDKIVVQIYLKNKKINCQLITEFLSFKNYLNIIKKNYKKFNTILNSLDKKKKVFHQLKNKDLNLFYNTFRYHGNKEFVGLKIFEKTLENILKKKKITTLILFGNFKGLIFNKEVRLKILQEKFFNKIEILSLPDEEIVEFNKSFKLHIFGYHRIIQLKILFKNWLNRLLPYKKTTIIFQPLFDFFYYPFNTKNFLYRKIDENFSTLFKTREGRINNNLNLNRKKFNILDRYLISNIFLIDLLIEKEFKLLKILLNNHKINKVLWCASPLPILSNIIERLKKEKNIKIYGYQHGGGYFTLNYDVEHQDSDFNFCDKFLSFGLNNKFKKKQKFIEIGSFRSQFFKKINIRSKEINLRNIMFVPTEIPTIFCPSYELRQDERFARQKNICNFLRSKKNDIIIKTIENFQSETFPISYNLKATYPSFISDKKPLYQSIKLYKPKIIIIDYLGTSLFECMYSNAEIILYLDKHNHPSSDVLNVLKKRVHFVYNHSEFVKKFNLIKLGLIKKQDYKPLNKYFDLKINKQKIENLLQI